MFLTAVRHEVNNLESFVVVQELELAINNEDNTAAIHTHPTPFK